MSRVSPETAEKLRRVVAAIKPGHFDMEDWLSAITPTGRRAFFQGNPMCSTVACFAGWACAVLGDGGDCDVVSDTAQALLGLDSTSAATKLFHLSHWAEDFEGLYQEAEGDRLAQLAILRERVEHFIATGE